jgi:hypothetical protein
VSGVGGVAIVGRRPDMARIDGSTEHTCRRCPAKVWLTPATVVTLAELGERALVLCWTCAMAPGALPASLPRGGNAEVRRLLGLGG